MDLYFHHVGQNGAFKDFPKTIYKSRTIFEVEKALPDDNPEKYHLVSQLKEKFPSGRFNCWGVPEGAKSIIRNLKVGDAVLLVESSRIDGKVPALCIVKVFVPIKLNPLSLSLWGDDKYPFIFFFDTEEIDLMWVNFREHLGYMERFDPRGNFYKVADDRLSEYGTKANYVSFIRNKYKPFKKNDIYLSNHDKPENIAEPTSEYLSSTNDEIDIIVNNINSQPVLKDSTHKQKSTVEITPRDQAFSRIIKSIYSNSCAVCSLAILSPEKQPEVQSAHIYPKSLQGSDDPRNGICLCRFHHWAFDCGWFSISNDYKIIVKNDIPNSEGYNEIKKYEGCKIHLPKKIAFAPHKIYLREHRKIFGFE